MSRDAHGSRYLTWTKQRRPVRYNLARSGVPRPSLDSLALTLDYITTVEPYDDGWSPYLERIARRYGVAPANVVTTLACSMANHLVFAAFLDAGDDVVVETPVYEPLVRLAEYRGARVVPLVRHEENGWRIDPDDARRAMTPRTRLIVLSNLNNPTGALDPDDTIARIAQDAAGHGATVLVDEVYLEFLYAPGTRTAMRLAENVVTTRSMTKAFGLDSLRSGWILAHPDTASRILRLNDLFSASSPQPGERIAARALEHVDAWLASTNAWLDANRARVDAFVRHHPRLSWKAPPAGTVGFVRLDGEDTALFADRLHRDHGVAIVPGHFFGAPGYFRIGWSLEPESLKTALEELGRGLRTHR